MKSSAVKTMRMGAGRMGAGLSVLALMMATTCALAQEVDIDELTGCEPIFDYTLTEEDPSSGLPVNSFTSDADEEEFEGDNIDYEDLEEMDGAGYSAYGPEVTVYDEGDEVDEDQIDEVLFDDDAAEFVLGTVDPNSITTRGSVSVAQINRGADRGAEAGKVKNLCDTAGPGWNWLCGVRSQ